MKKYLVLSILSLMCIGTGAQGVQKMSRDIRQLVTSQERRVQGTKQPETVRAMIRFSSNAEAVMAQYHCKAITHIGDIYIADIPISQLKAMADDGQVERIENHVGAKVLMDVAPKWINSPAIYEDTRLPQAYTGKGVMLGIIDVGLEVTHPNFYHADSTSLRVTRFLDQFAADDEPYGKLIDLGREYTTEADIKGKGYAGDSYRQFHGTHCLGISAGSGHTTPYRGVAYEAELAAANSKVAGDSGFGSANELALMKYLFDYADERQMPCVITYSIGFNALPNDCVLFEEGISQLTGPGHILVAAAGNESYKLDYVCKPKGMAAAGTCLIDDKGGMAFLYSKDQFTLKVISKLKKRVDGSLKGDSLVYTPSLTDREEKVEKQLAGKAVVVEKVDTCYTITFTRDSTDTDDGTVLFVIEGEDSFVQMVVEMEQEFTNNTKIDPRCGNATNDHNVGLPGCLPSVVTVGALNTREKFVNIQGDTIASWGVMSNEGTIGYFSSQGPTLDGLIKPDVVAPGINIHASANSHYEEDYGAVLVAKSTFEGREYPWIAISGTSMATPCMAGIVALWLQANPQLSPDDVKRIISETSHPIGDVIPNNTYGYGLADAYAGVLNILGLPTTIKDLSQHQPSALTIRPADGGIRLSFNQAPTKPFTVRVYAVSGQLLGEQVVRPTASTDYLLPLGHASGICVVQVNSPEQGVTGSELIRH
jgi:subtilisin family serine protease